MLELVDSLGAENITAIIIVSVVMAGLSVWLTIRTTITHLTILFRGYPPANAIGWLEQPCAHSDNMTKKCLVNPETGENCRTKGECYRVVAQQNGDV